MKIKSNKLAVLFLIIGISIPLIVAGKLLYDHYSFVTDEGLQTQLIEKISQAENVYPDDVAIIEIGYYHKEGTNWVWVYYNVNNGEQKELQFTYTQDVYGEINVGK
jgi:hypothetical protein